jgi:hypothetical protein
MIQYRSNIDPTSIQHRSSIDPASIQHRRLQLAVSLRIKLRFASFSPEHRASLWASGIHRAEPTATRHPPRSLGRRRDRFPAAFRAVRAALRVAPLDARLGRGLHGEGRPDSIAREPRAPSEGDVFRGKFDDQSASEATSGQSAPFAASRRAAKVPRRKCLSPVVRQTRSG